MNKQGHAEKRRLAVIVAVLMQRGSSFSDSYTEVKSRVEVTPDVELFPYTSVLLFKGTLH